MEETQERCEKCGTYQITEEQEQRWEKLVAGGPLEHYEHTKGREGLGATCDLAHLYIESDGSGEGTTVKLEDGRDVCGVAAIRWEMESDPNDVGDHGMASVTIRFVGIPLKVSGGVVPKAVEV